jgi:hemolysin activation/secretion protein
MRLSNMKKPALSSLGLFFLAGAAFMPSIVHAQAPLDAGSLQQQMERQQQEALPQHDLGVPAQPGMQAPAGAETFKITVSAFRFEGNNLLSDAELSSAVAPYLNRPINFNELQNAAAAVGEAYRAKGWVVRAFLPQQDIVDGVVTIRVVEASFGKTTIEGGENTWPSQEKIQAMVAAQQPADGPMNTGQLDRAILLIDDLPGVSAAGRLQEGQKPGETDLAVKLVAEPFATGLVTIDNEGARATGYERIHGGAQLLSPLGMGDQTSVFALYSRGLRFARLEQSFPVCNDGLRVGVNGSILDYRVLPSEFDALDGKGNSQSIGLQASYPVIRARKKNLYLDLNYDRRYFENDANDATSSDYRTDSVTAGLRGNMFDEFAGGGSTNASLSFTTGKLDLGALDAGEDPDLDGSYRKIAASASRHQTITETVSLYASASGQYSTDRKLDTSEKFYLGGPGGVRAYPVSEGSGSSGALFTIEPRWNFAPNYQFSAFYDQGYVYNRDDSKSYGLKGAGLAFTWQSESGLSFQGTWSHRIGGNPNDTPTGEDQDGSDIENRFWLTLSRQF